MRKLLQLAAVALVLVFAACGPSTEDVISYNDGIVADQSELIMMENEIVENIYDYYDYPASKKSYDAYTAKVNELLTKYEEMKPFDDEDEFRVAMIDLLKVHKEQLEEYYLVIIDFMEVYPDVSEVDDESAENIVVILDAILEATNAQNEKFLETQKVFAKKYNVELI